MAVQRCVESFTVWRGGVPITFTAGQLLEEKHPILKTHGHLFQDVATAARPRQAQRVEAAVNDPGSARALTPPTETGSPDPDIFDPTQHVTKDVLAYLDTVGEAEATRVLDAEAAADSPRAGVTKARDKVLADARERDEQAAGPAE